MSKQPRILELDAFAPKPDTLRYQGKDYEIMPLNVEEFTKLLSAAEDLKEVAAGSSGNGEEVRAALGAARAALSAIRDLIGSKAPGFPADRLSIEEVTVIVKWLADGFKEPEAAAAIQDPEKKEQAAPAPSPSA